MADMYTTLSACRSYLYTIARATAEGRLTNKVKKREMKKMSDDRTKSSQITSHTLNTLLEFF